MNMRLCEIDKWIRRQLPIDDMARKDASLNGIQVGQADQDVKTVAFAVDACRETFRRAAALKADMLVVHHGLFWGKPLAVTGPHYDRLNFLMENHLALYAAHLPLDMDPELGNNIQLARLLELTNVEAFGDYHGDSIGFAGRLPQEMSIDELSGRLTAGAASDAAVLPFGPEKIRSVGIVSGGAPNCVSEAIEKGLDCFITGDASHQIYHQAQEAGIHVIFGGHYKTEIWGVRALAARMKEELKLETVFVDVPTGL